MQIRQTPEIVSFLEACQKNLRQARINAFLDRKVTRQNEHDIQLQLHRLGVPEFQGPAENWPSLFLSPEVMKKNPYLQAIALPEGTYGDFSLERIILDPGYLFSVEALQKDPERRLNEWLKLRALPEEAETIQLYQKDEPWMLAAPGEFLTNDPPARKAHGRVLTMGLGIGYFVFMAMRNPAVTSITVIEQSPAVIALFETLLRPQFPAVLPLQIIQADARDWFRAEVLQDYDYCYVDLWQSSEDGLDLMEQLLERCCPAPETCDFWIEDSCLEPMRALLVLAFAELLQGSRMTVAPAYEKRMEKVRRWAAADPRTISDVSVLQDCLYDNALQRRILAGLF